MTDAPQNFEVKAQWILDAMTPPVVVNQMLLQAGGASASGYVDGAYVIFGHLNPPVINTPDGLPPTPDMFSGSVFPIAPVGRFFVSRERLVAFRDEMTKFLDATEPKG